MAVKFAKAQLATPPKTEAAPKVALFFAAIVLVMTLGQLFSFEKFIPLIESFRLPGGHGAAVLTATLLVTAGVFSLPFLLRMKLSPLMRVVSMVSGWVMVGSWFFLVIWVNVHGSALGSMGLFGASIDTPIGWWAVPYVVALGILAAWASWGLWPSKKHN